jgi:hypothetical protein
LTITIEEPHINSLEDLAASKDVKILLLADYLPKKIFVRAILFFYPCKYLFIEENITFRMPNLVQ